MVPLMCRSCRTSRTGAYRPPSPDSTFGVHGPGSHRSIPLGHPAGGWALRRRVASSLPACTRSRALGVPVFGGVGPPVAACATIAGRFVPVARARAAAHRRAVSVPRPRAGAGGPCAFTRCRVVRGGGVMRCAGRRVRPGGAAGGLAPPAPAAPDTRRAGPRRRAVPARE